MLRWQRCQRAARGRSADRGTHMDIVIGLLTALAVIVWGHVQEMW